MRLECSNPPDCSPHFPGCERAENRPSWHPMTVPTLAQGFVNEIRSPNVKPAKRPFRCVFRQVGTHAPWGGQACPLYPAASSMNERKWIGIEPEESSLSAYEVSKKVINLLRHCQTTTRRRRSSSILEDQEFSSESISTSSFLVG